MIFFGPEINSLHIFFQLTDQGTNLIPTDFIGYVELLYGNKDHHDKLLSNYFAQAEVLTNAKKEVEVLKELKGGSMSKDAISTLTPFRIF